MSSAIPVSQWSRPQGERPLSQSAGLLGLLGLLLAGFLPLLVRFFSEQWGRPQYQFFPLMIVAAAYVAWQRIQEIDADSIRKGKQTLFQAILGVSLFLLVAAFLLWSGRTAAIGMWIALAGVAYRYGGWAMLRALAPAGLLLALVIGPPLGLEDTLLQKLRELAVWVSGGTLLWLDIPHLTTGTIIEIRGNRLLVAEACSGINSLLAVLGFTLVLGFLKRHNGARLAMLLLFAAIFALWANVGRITLGVWLKAAKDVDILSGAIHEWTSIILFCVSMALVFSVDAMISLVLLLAARRRTNARDPLPPEPRVPTRLPAFPVTRGTWSFAAVFALLGVVQVGNALAQGGLSAWFSNPFNPRLPLGTALSLPHTLAGWERSEADEKLLAQPEIEGKRSQAWVFNKGDIHAVVAIDFPFAGFHDLMLCYQNAGWTISEKTLKVQPTPQGEAPYIAARVDRLKEHGYSWFGSVNERGTWVEPPATTRAGQLQQRLRHIGRPDWSSATYQVQIWVQSYELLTPQRRQELEALYLAVRADLAAQLLQKLQGAQ